MSAYMTEEEQIENIKRFWNKHGNTILVTVSIILLSIAAFRYWNSYQDKMKLQASNLYEQMMVSYAQKKPRAVESYANKIIKDYKSSIYAKTAYLVLAKLNVEKNNLIKAETDLKQMINSSNTAALKQVARLRLARILASKKEFKKALNQLSILDAPIYLPLVNELKGDIYTAKGDYVKAIKSYRLALEESKKRGGGSLFLKMKTNEVATLTQQVQLKEQVKAA